MAGGGNGHVHLVARKLAALAGFGALRNFNLQLVGIDQIGGGDAEAPGSYLFNGATAVQAVGAGLEAGGVFAAFTGVALAVQRVQGDGQRFVRFLADRAV